MVKKLYIIMFMIMQGINCSLFSMEKETEQLRIDKLHQDINGINVLREDVDEYFDLLIDRAIRKGEGAAVIRNLKTSHMQMLNQKTYGGLAANEVITARYSYFTKIVQVEVDEKNVPQEKVVQVESFMWLPAEVPSDRLKLEKQDDGSYLLDLSSLSIFKITDLARLFVTIEINGIDVLKMVGELEQLSLDLSNNKLTSLEGLKNLKNLYELNFSGNKLDIHEELFRLSDFKHLRVLNLSNNQINDSTSSLMLDRKGHPKYLIKPLFSIRKLDISGNNFTRWLAWFNAFIHLHELTIDTQDWGESDLAKLKMRIMQINEAVKDSALLGKEVFYFSML